MPRQSSKLIFVNRYFFPDESPTSVLLGELIFSLVKRGFWIEVITGRQRYGGNGKPLGEQEAIQQVRVKRVWAFGWDNAFFFGRLLDHVIFYFSGAWHLFWCLRRGDLVVVKTDPPLMSLVVLALVKLRRAAMINWIQDLYPEILSFAYPRLRGSVWERVLTRLRNSALRGAVHNVVVDQKMADRLIRQGLSASQITVIHNWADGGKIRPFAPAKNPLRRQWNLDGKFVVGYCGNLGRLYEFDTFLDAMTDLKEKKEIHGVLVGEGAKRRHLLSEIKRRGLENIDLYAYQLTAHLSYVLSVPDVHVIPMRRSASGLIMPSKLYSILAAGRPVIFVGDAHSTVRRILEEYRCGFYVEPGHHNELSKLIHSLSEDRQRVRRMSDRCRSVFERHYDQRIAIATWTNVLSRYALAPVTVSRQAQEVYGT